MYDTTQSMKRFYDNAVGLYKYMFGEEEKPKQHKRKFMRRLMKWCDENGPRVESKKNESKHEEPTKVIDIEEKTEYTDASLISLSFAIHHLRSQLKEKQKQEPIITPPFEMKPSLPRVFTLNDAYEYLQHLYDHSCTLPILLSQIPDYLENERDLLVVQKLMIKRQLKEIIRKEINDDESIEERIEKITPEIEEKSSLLWFMHVMAKAKEERHWMKRLLISYRYRQVMQAIVTYMSTKITEKTRYLTMVDKRVFSRAWIQKCYPQDPELGTAIIKKLL
jgi:organic radical activating enzyme